MTSTDQHIVNGIRPGNVIIWEKDRHTIKLLASSDGGSILYWGSIDTPDNQQIVDFLKTHDDFAGFVRVLAVLHQLIATPYRTPTGKPAYIFRDQKSS